MTVMLLVAGFQNRDSFAEGRDHTDRGKLALRLELPDACHEPLELSIGMLALGFEALVNLLLQGSDQNLEFTHIPSDKILNRFLNGLGDIFRHAALFLRISRIFAFAEFLVAAFKKGAGIQASRFHLGFLSKGENRASFRGIRATTNHKASWILFAGSMK
jgi:hypothetical protein